MDFSFLSENQSTKFEVTSTFPAFQDIEEVSIKEFYNKCNGGGFFANALIFYPSNHDQFSLENMGAAVNAKYSKYVDHCVYFGCDLFGNQYGYQNGQIVCLNIESAISEVLASSFKEFIKLISHDVDYYTGEPFVKEWNNRHDTLLAPEKRLCPTYPFILGGEYSIENMYEMNVLEILDYNENIAQQIFNTPDGTNIKIRLTR